MELEPLLVRRNLEGNAEEGEAARAGEVRATPPMKKSSGAPATVPVNCVHTQAWYTSPARMASRHAKTPSR